jgi:hypothetical protein
MREPRYPSLYQINTRVWLTAISQLQDQLGTASYEWNGDDLQGRGLYLDMAL